MTQNNTTTTRGYIPHEVVEYHAVDEMPLVKAWRKYLGLTQKELAEKANMAQSALARIESGKHEAREETLQKLAKAMNLTLEQLTLKTGQNIKPTICN